jgi:hypothetical protein
MSAYGKTVAIERLGARELKQRFHVIVIGVERAERREIPGARIPFGDEVLSGAPCEFRLAVLYGIISPPRPPKSRAAGVEFRNANVAGTIHRYLAGTATNCAGDARCGRDKHHRDSGDIRNYGRKRKGAAAPRAGHPAQEALYPRES